MMKIKIGRLEIIIKVHPGICKGKMIFKRFSYKASHSRKLYRCTKCKFGQYGCANTNWGNHKVIK